MALIIVSGCSSVRERLNQSAGRELVLEPVFVRHTPERQQFGYRQLNRMTPVIANDFVIQGNSIDGLIKYDRKSGHELWRLPIENGVEGGVALSGDNLYFGAGDGLLRSASLSTGAVNWTVPVRAELLSAPTLDSGVLFAQTGADVIYGLEAGTGKLLWTYNRLVTGNLSVRSTTRPVVAGDLLLVGFSDGSLVALKKRDGSIKWERKLGRGNRFRDVDSTAVVNRGRVYTASYDGVLAALKLETGEILWQAELGGYLPVTVGSGASADRLYFSTADGRIVELDEATGKELRTHKLSSGIATQPVVHKNLLIFGESEGALRVLDLGSLRTLAQYQSGNGLLSTPALDRDQNEIWFISSAANLYAMKLSYRRVADRFPWKKSDSSQQSFSF
jgi:outer membrane protein assembly factor BamB